MVNFEQVVDNGSTSSLLEQLGKALHKLESCNDVSDDRVQWTEIEEHFRNLETTFKKKMEELEVREKEYEEKEAETHALLAEREATVVSKEQDLLDRVQLLKDAAVAVIAEARASNPLISLDSMDGGNNNNKVSSSHADTNSLEEYSPHEMGKNAEGVAANAKPRPELTQFCEQMDAKGLVNFTMENQKNLNAIREELSIALESATEPARLVLDSLEGFYPLVETTQPMDKSDAALQGMRKSCIMIMESMAALLARVDPGAEHLVNPEIKQQAKAIADEWKPKLASAGTDATNGNSLEADAFLQLLSTFKIASEFDEEELCKIVLVVAHRRQAPELCRSLGLTHKMPGVIETLVSSGKQINAVHFIHAFQLVESFPPVPLLKTYLKDLRRNSQGKGANSGATGGAQIDANAQELAALKAVIKCVQEYKLEDDYPLDPLQRRVAQLDKMKPDKKRTGDFGKHKQLKKPKHGRGYRGFRGSDVPGATGVRQTPPVFIDRTVAYTGMSERYPHAVPNPYDYQAPSQSAYGQQATEQGMYYYPQDHRLTPSSYNATSSNYGGYMGTGMRSSHQPYM